MLKHKFLADDGILVIEPDAPLEASDFETLAREVDGHIAQHGDLKGLVIRADAFPGWANLEAALAHFRFIQSHHRHVAKLAVVSDNRLLTEAPKLISHLVHPEVRHFPEAEYEAAVRWLKE